MGSDCPWDILHVTHGTHAKYVSSAITSYGFPSQTAQKQYVYLVSKHFCIETKFVGVIHVHPLLQLFIDFKKVLTLTIELLYNILTEPGVPIKLVLIKHLK
jgi:hypothetical protein